MREICTSGSMRGVERSYGVSHKTASARRNRGGKQTCSTEGHRATLLLYAFQPKMGFDELRNFSLSNVSKSLGSGHL